MHCNGWPPRRAAASTSSTLVAATSFEIDAADAAPLVMDLQHDLRRRLEIALEVLLQHHHDELHRRVVVVEQDHLVHPRRLGLLRLALDDDRSLPVVGTGAGRSRRQRLVGWHEFILSSWRLSRSSNGILAPGDCFTSARKRSASRHGTVRSEAAIGGSMPTSSRSGVREKKPAERRALRGRREPDHMLSIITWPKPEHDTWVAPSIRRAKS